MTISAKTIFRLFLLLLFSYFSYQLISSPQPWIILDGANLVFHEAGHIIFLPLGEFMSILGGSLNQILFPIIFTIYFLIKKQYFSAIVVLFWVGESIINVSVYIADAQEMRLPLLIDGTTHDWNWILNHLNLLSSAKIIGNTFYYLGLLLITLSITGIALATFFEIVTKPNSQTQKANP